MWKPFNPIKLLLNKINWGILKTYVLGPSYDICINESLEIQVEKKKEKAKYKQHLKISRISTWSDL